MSDQFTLANMYELVAEVGFKRHFHLGGSEATRELLDLCAIRRDSYILDVGCASRKTACHVAQSYGCQVVGVDILPRMVERAMERALAEGVVDSVGFTVGDARKLPLDENQFDVVLGEFITGMVEEKARAISEYIRVARPGGTIGLNEATWLQTPLPPETVEFVTDALGYGGHLLTAEEWTDLLESCGVKGIQTRIHKADSLSNPREDYLDLLRTLPKVVQTFVRRPQFRELMRLSRHIPPNLLDYFGYGLYVGHV